jgi:Na+/H+ antiporter 1
VTSLPARRVLSRGSWAEAARLADVLRKETVGGLLLLAATVVALVWANSPWRFGMRPCGTRWSAPRRCTWT